MTPRALIFDVFSRWLYPVIMLISIWLLLRGHNAPGGGFIGGMVAVAATAMYAMSHGAVSAERRQPFGAQKLACAGVLLSALSGVPALFQELPYMTHLWGTIPLGFTDLKVSTVLLFDLGVYCAVWGALGGLCARSIDLKDQPA